ncbi:pre-mRNA processing RNA-helicase [Hypoxylon texense]
MGNICGKSDSEAFAQPGRVLGSAPPQPQRAPVPPTISSPPRTLGGSAPTPAQSAQNGSNADEARRRAAEAAEARAKAASKSTGKLGTQLAAQKKQTRNDTLKEVANNAIRQRDADEAAQARSHN